MARVKISSVPTIRRLPSYLHIIEAAQKEGKDFISGTVIAEELELEPIQVRKDLAITGISGKPRIGFPVAELLDAITKFLDWHHTHRAILVGAGNLGTALAGYAEFNRHGMSILAAFDSDSRKQGTRINGVEVFPLEKIGEKVKELEIELAVLTVPSPYAQETTEVLLAAGIKAIWNFTNIKLKVPKGIIVQKEDLSSGYAVLSVKIARNRN
ncbi:MAG: redox-sensing transcriptional repressor Rex [Spirochaetales bacterium]|nr:redox-sensing transcriptional repressor Rex [Spirochaetales bacterium]